MRGSRAGGTSWAPGLNHRPLVLTGGGDCGITQPGPESRCGPRRPDSICFTRHLHTHFSSFGASPRAGTQLSAAQQWTMGQKSERGGLGSLSLENPLRNFTEQLQCLALAGDHGKVESCWGSARAGQPCLQQVTGQESSCPCAPGTARREETLETDFSEFGWKGQLGQPLDVTARSECRIKAQDEGVNSQKNKPWLTATCQYLHPIQIFVFMRVWAPTTISRPSSLARPSSNLICSAFTKD